MTMSNPYLVTAFTVVIDKIDDTIQFREVSGLDSANSIVKYREGADPMHATRNIPGLEEVKVVTLKRGLSSSLALWEWRKEVRDSSTAFPPYRNVTITLNDGTRGPIVTWVLTNAWCSKLTGPVLNAAATGDPSIAFESVDISYDRIDLRAGG